jgi:hypothetical protein
MIEKILRSLIDKFENMMCVTKDPRKKAQEKESLEKEKAKKNEIF